MTRDPIIDEVRRLRLETEQACGHDWNKLADHYRKVAAQFNHPVFRGSPRRPASPESPGTDVSDSQP